VWVDEVCKVCLNYESTNIIFRNYDIGSGGVHAQYHRASYDKIQTSPERASCLFEQTALDNQDPAAAFAMMCARIAMFKEIMLD